MKRDTLKHPLQQLKQAGLDRTSLQLRLTVGITTIALLGIGTIGTWTAWKMRKMLVVDHIHTVEAVAEQLSAKLAQSSPKQWPMVVNQGLVADIWCALKPKQGDMIVRSPAPKQLPSDMMAAPWAEISTTPRVETVQNRHLVLARQSLYKTGQPIGELYLAQDITHDYNVLSSLINTLRFATALALATIAALIAMYIRGSLRPLRRINQLAANTGQSDFTLPNSALSDQPIPSEMQGLVQAISTLANRLSETGEKQREFTNGLSHELRTSLCLIQGYLGSTLRRGDNLTPAQREALEIAASETKRTVHLLQDLLDLGRINSGKIDLSLQPVELNDLVMRSIEQVDPDQVRQIRVESQGAIVMAQADVTQLQRILIHLLDNAIQFSPVDRPIQVDLQQTEDAAMIQVTDQGIGIAEADQPHVFEPFYRVETSRCRSTGGMGLGLAIVKSLVEAMGGEVSLKSTLGLGSVFTVRLPVAKDSEAKDLNIDD